jgi:hypothetical protein
MYREEIKRWGVVGILTLPNNKLIGRSSIGNCPAKENITIIRG